MFSWLDVCVFFLIVVRIATFRRPGVYSGALLFFLCWLAAACAPNELDVTALSSRTAKQTLLSSCVYLFFCLGMERRSITPNRQLPML